MFVTHLQSGICLSGKVYTKYMRLRCYARNDKNIASYSALGGTLDLMRTQEQVECSLGTFLQIRKYLQGCRGGISPAIQTHPKIKDFDPPLKGRVFCNKFINLLHLLFVNKCNKFSLDF